MKKRQGSVLALVLMIFSIVMVFGTVSISIALNESGQSIRHENKTKAYYIARSGAEAVEAALLQMGKEEKEDLTKELDKSSILVEPINIKGNIANVTIVKESSNKIAIKSKAKVDNVDETVTKVMEVYLETENIIYNMEYPIYALGNLLIEGGTIEGNIGSNKKIHINGWPTINKKYEAHLVDKANFTKQNKEMAPSLKVKDGNPEKAFMNIAIESPPANNSPYNYFANTNSGDRYFYNSDYYYNKFVVSEKILLKFDTKEGDITLVTNHFDVHGDIEIIGSGNLNLIILDSFQYQGDFNINGESEKLNIFYYGQKDFIWPNNGSSIKTSLYITGSPLIIKSGDFEGQIFSNGNDVKINNEGGIFNVAVYAPLSDIDIIGGKLSGVIVGKDIYIRNSGPIISFNSNYSTIKVPSNIETNIIKFTPGYYR